MVMLDKPHEIEFFKLAQVCSRLKIELQGLSFKQPTLKHAKRYYRLDVNTKRGAFEVLDAVKARVLEGSDIYREIAKLRGSALFFICTHCGWRGDVYTVGQHEDKESGEGFFCPNCKVDESGLDITEFEKGD